MYELVLILEFKIFILDFTPREFGIKKAASWFVRECTGGWAGTMTLRWSSARQKSRMLPGYDLNLNGNHVRFFWAKQNPQTRTTFQKSLPSLFTWERCSSNQLLGGKSRKKSFHSIVKRRPFTGLSPGRMAVYHMNSWLVPILEEYLLRSGI